MLVATQDQYRLIIVFLNQGNVVMISSQCSKRSWRISHGNSSSKDFLFVAPCVQNYILFTSRVIQTFSVKAVDSHMHLFFIFKTLYKCKLYSTNILCLASFEDNWIERVSNFVEFKFQMFSTLKMLFLLVDRLPSTSPPAPHPLHSVQVCNCPRLSARYLTFPPFSPDKHVFTYSSC